MNNPLDDGISSVELINHMGDDLMVVNAARVSYQKESDWANEPFEEVIKKTGQEFADAYFKEAFLKDEDKKLIHYLASHNHWTPFSHPQLQFRIKMPIFIAREWYRHCVGVTRNEVSRRYVNTEPEFFIPKELRNKPELGKSKQGSSNVHNNSDIWSEYIKETLEKNSWVYDDLIKAGIAPEQARIVLPVSMYTEFIETGSLYFYSHLCNLRMNPDVMKECRLYAETVSELIQPLFPVSWKELVNDKSK